MPELKSLVAGRLMTDAEKAEYRAWQLEQLNASRRKRGLDPVAVLPEEASTVTKFGTKSEVNRCPKCGTPYSPHSKRCYQCQPGHHSKYQRKLYAEKAQQRDAKAADPKPPEPLGDCPQCGTPYKAKRRRCYQCQPGGQSSKFMPKAAPKRAAVTDASVFPDNSPAQQLAQLERLKFMLGQLPWQAAGPEVEIEPPGNALPKVINLHRASLEIRWHTLEARISVIEEAIQIRKIAGLPASPALMERVVSLADDIVKLQEDMAK